MLIPITLGFLAGAWISIHCDGLLLWGLWFAALVFSIILKKIHLKSVCYAFISIAFGLLYTEQYIQRHKTPESLKQQDNQVVVLQGKVVGIPQAKQGLTQFDWQLSNATVRVLWRSASFPVHAGDIIEASVRIRRPSALMNPGQDERRLWLNQGIHASAQVMGPVRLLESRWTLDRLRESIEQKAQKVGRKLDTWPLIEALVLGVKKEIPIVDRQAFQATGTSHLMAISGLHIGLIALMGLFIGKGISRACFPGLLHRIPSQVIGSGLALGVAVLYAALAGFSIPTQRALIMILVGLCALFYRLSLPPKDLLSIAGIGVLLWDPLSVQSPGFWLSFVAVAWLLTVASEEGFQKKLIQWGRTQTALLLGLAPFTVWYFKSFSWVSPIANAIAIPWSSFVVVPTAFIGFILLPFTEKGAFILFSIANAGLEYLLIFLHLLEKLPMPLISWEASLGACFFALTGTVLLCIPASLPGRWVGLFLWLPFVFSFKDLLKEGEAKVLLFDVGQGLALSIETAHHHLLYDLGPKSGQKSTVAEKVIVPYLEKKRVKSLDGVVVSHFDADHAGGLPSISSRWPIRQPFSSDPTNVWKADFCRQGLKWQWDGVIFEFLHPEKPKVTKKRNNLSCVLRVQAGEHSLLLTGDIEAAVEKKLIKEGVNLKSSVLLVPHHGSRTSSSVEFIEAVNPQVAIISSGRYNTYRHPRPEILERYQLAHVLTMDTAKLGAIELRLKAKHPIEIHHFSGGKLENLWYTW